MIYNLFPVPVLEQNLERNFTETELSFCNMCRESLEKNDGNTTSTNRYVLEDDRLKSVRSFAMNGVNLFIKDIVCPKENVTPYITQSWFNYTDKGQYHHKHTHPNSYISGVMYFSSDEEKDKITFYNPNFNYILDLPTENFNPYNSQSWWLKAKTGTMYIFPSKIHHEVYITESSDTRISLSFNVFMKGQIGEEKTLTSLRL